MPRTRTLTGAEPEEEHKGGHLRALPDGSGFRACASSREMSGSLPLRSQRKSSLLQFLPEEGGAGHFLHRSYSRENLRRHCPGGANGQNPLRKDPAGQESLERRWDPLPPNDPSRPSAATTLPLVLPLAPSLKGESAFLGHVPKFPGQLLSEGSMKPDGKVVLLGDMNVGKTSLLHRYMERRFQDTVSTVGGAFYLKHWGQHNISIWDTAGREQFHGLGSMYCRGAAAVILTYDVTNLQTMVELEDRFLALTDTASTDCIFAIVGNKADLTDACALLPETEDECHSETHCVSSKMKKQVHSDDAIALYKKILKYKMLDEKNAPAAENMCFETSAKTGYKVDHLFETVFEMVVPVILQQKTEGSPQTVDLGNYKTLKNAQPGCCR